MTYNQAVKELGELIRALAQEKDDKERRSILLLIKAHVELAQAPLKKLLNKKKAAYEAKTKIIKPALKQFLTALDRIYDKHEEFGDTDVKEQIYGAVHKSFIIFERDYSLPEKFGMFSDEGNTLVRAALSKFLDAPRVSAARRSLKSGQDRLAAFQDDDVETSKGTTIFEYFGYRNKPVPYGGG